MTVRAQEPCESRGWTIRAPVPNKPNCFCERKATLQQQHFNKSSSAGLGGAPQERTVCRPALPYQAAGTVLELEREEVERLVRLFLELHGHRHLVFHITPEIWRGEPWSFCLPVLVKQCINPLGRACVTALLEAARTVLRSRRGGGGGGGGCTRVRRQHSHKPP